jgi:hypothetical protein
MPMGAQEYYKKIHGRMELGKKYVGGGELLWKI